MGVNLRKTLVPICVLALAIIACISSVTEPALTELTRAPVPAGQKATVVDVIDGDTITVDINGQSYRLRYIGMDTPERDEAFYQEATAANEALVSGRNVILVKDVSETDRYGRLLRYVYLQDGTFVNAELVKQGYAVAVTYPPDVKHADLFRELERAARQDERGLWQKGA